MHRCTPVNREIGFHVKRIRMYFIVYALTTMLVFCVIAVLVSTFDFALGSAIGREQYDNDMELVLAFVVHRHGERTPAEEEAALSKDEDAIKKLIELEGFEALTNEGKRRAYQIGKFLRHRYGSANGANLLSKEYRYNELEVRCTAKDRTRMTAQIAMAALYPPLPVQQWDEGLGSLWQPVPYTSVPLSEDYLRYYSNCDRFKFLMAEAKNASWSAEFEPYKDLIPLLKKHTGTDFSEDPLLFETLYDLFSSQVGLGMVIPEWAKPHLARITEAARLGYRLYFKNDEMKKIGGGVILNDFIETSKAIITGQKVDKRIRIYSSHDFNIGSLMEVAKVENFNQKIPEYGALFALELYRAKNGEYFVLPVYLQQAGTTSAMPMTIMGCEDNCDFSKFRNLTSEYILPEKEFYNICKIRTEM